MISITNNRQKLGGAGEEEAVNYLKKRGYKILDRNWQPKFSARKIGELDIVAKRDKTLVFCEVKTLTGGSHSSFSPEDKVNYFKQRILIKTAKLYILEKKLDPELPWQIDILAVWFDEFGRKWAVRHFPNAVFE